MKLLNSPYSDTKICVLPNGVTFELTVVNVSGTKSSVEQDVDEVVNVVKSLPASIVSNQQNCVI